MWEGNQGCFSLQSRRYKALAKRKHSFSNLHESAGLGEEVVDGVAGHPHHRREREAETETLRPARILVAAQLDGLEGDDVEDEDAEHDEGGEVLPAEVPEDVRLVPGHLLDAVTEPGLTDEAQK